MSGTAVLGVADYVVFSSVLFISFVIGVVSTKQASKSTDDYLTGGRNMHFIPVGFSLVTSFISAISLLGISGDVYTNGIQLYIMLVGGAFGTCCTLFTTLPVFAKLRLTTMNEYLWRRFKSASLMKFISFVFSLSNLLYMGICLYAPTIALAAVTSLDMYTYIYILGAVCTIYSSLGGLRAVVWTDVFQLIVMSIGLITITVIGVGQVGGIAEVWNIGTAGNRTELFNMTWDLYERHTFWGTFFTGFFNCFFIFGVSQLNLQRIASVPDENAAQKVIGVTAFGILFLYIFVFLTGLVPYAAYVGCDPLKLGILTKKEEILPYFVLDKISFIYGLPGLFIASCFSGTLSSLSSAINVGTALIYKDFLEKLSCFKTASTTVRVLVNQSLSILLGLGSIGVSLICTKTNSLIDFNMIVGSVVGGPLFGVFLLGLFVPVGNAFGAWCGLLSAWMFMLWISVGSALFSPPTESLPLSIDSCNSTDTFRAMSSNFTDWDVVEEMKPKFVASPYMLSIYNISHMWYPPFSTLISFIVGSFVSYFVGNDDTEKVDRNLINPYICQWYFSDSHELKKEKKDLESKVTTM